ncbi:unnamed protein product [Symbiodinium sp. CCMP2592]|nr:unnamed protein product [Symbiodinium sp. CCMP2592]
MEHWVAADWQETQWKLEEDDLGQPKLNLVDGLHRDHFYDQSLCQAPDLRTGRLVTKKEGNRKFFLASDDGSLMYLNGENVVDNNGCHGEHEKGSGDKFLKPGADEIVVHMCEKGGGEVLKMRWEGRDSGNSKVKIPAAVLKHEEDGAAKVQRGLQCFDSTLTWRPGDGTNFHWLDLTLVTTLVHVAGFIVDSPAEAVLDVKPLSRVNFVECAHRPPCPGSRFSEASRL